MNKHFLPVALVTAFLVGCGGHGFEGEWKPSYDSKFTKPGGMDKFASMIGSDVPLYIGDDYVEQNGQRVELDIFERESSGKKYLVMKSDSGSEDVFTIVNDETLRQGNGFFTVTYKRMDK